MDEVGSLGRVGMVREVRDGEMGCQCFEVEALWTEVGRQLVWTLRVAGNTGRGTPWKLPPIPTLFVQAAAEHTTADRRPDA